MMDELKDDLAKTRDGMNQVRIELSRRPTRKQFFVVIGVAVVVVLIVCVGAIAAVRSANDSGDAKDSTEEVKDGFFISACRTDINAQTVVAAQQNLDAAEQERASAVAKRDNFTSEGLSALAAGDEEAILRIARLTPAARDLVTWNDAVVLNRVEELDSARADYQDVISRSIQDPDGFIEECRSRGD